MRWRVIAIGKPKLVHARMGIADYAQRLTAWTTLKFDYLRAGNREAESAAIMRRSEGMFRIALDERGEEITSTALAGRLGQWEQRGGQEMALLIGGANGHDETLRAAADWQWSLSKLTLQHELALLVALEQIYRAYTIKAGTPYHRG